MPLLLGYVGIGTRGRDCTGTGSGLSRLPLHWATRASDAGAPGRNLTCNLPVRSRALYMFELRERIGTAPWICTRTVQLLRLVPLRWAGAASNLAAPPRFALGPAVSETEMLLFTPRGKLADLLGLAPRTFRLGRDGSVCLSYRSRLVASQGSAPCSPV